MVNKTFPGKGVFVTGIGTEVGKTVVSAILCKAFGAQYWKPVQAGDLENTDAMKVSKWVGADLVAHPEAYRLNTPASPHYSAAVDGITIAMDQLHLPPTQAPLVVEGAGGLLVPLNDRQSMADLIQKLQLPVVLVSRHYLGSINHTLLSLAYLARTETPVAGVVFVGDPNPATEEIIAAQGECRIWGRIPMAAAVTPEFIAEQAKAVAAWG